VLVFGDAPRRARKRIALVGGRAKPRWSLRRPISAGGALAEAAASGADLLLLDDPSFEDPGGARRTLAEAVRQGRTVFYAASDPARVELLAHRVGILAGGRLVLDEELMKLEHAFRRIRYSNEMTETRSEYGNELDAFDAVAVRVRGWGVEAIVSDFDEEKFARFRAMDGVREARAEALSLSEIFEAVSARPARG
jgi:ABC-type multidrug transport system ATPase subunit